MVLLHRIGADGQTSSPAAAADGGRLRLVGNFSTSGELTCRALTDSSLLTPQAQARTPLPSSASSGRRLGPRPLLSDELLGLDIHGAAAAIAVASGQLVAAGRPEQALRFLAVCAVGLLLGRPANKRQL